MEGAARVCRDIADEIVRQRLEHESHWLQVPTSARLHRSPSSQ